jgi:hypothetical protein
LDSIVKAKGQTSDDADEKLEDAIKMFCRYERKYLFKNEDPTEYERRDKTFLKRMDEAKTKKLPILARLKKALLPKVRLPALCYPILMQIPRQMMMNGKNNRRLLSSSFSGSP